MKAFPQAQFRGDEPVDTSKHGGMDLRDYFAGLAMQSIVMCAYDPNFETEGNEVLVQRGISITAYQIADEMMEARTAR